MFGDRLRLLRERDNYSMDRLVQLYNKTYNAKMNKSTLSRYENNLQEPIYTVVVNLSKLFHVSVDYMLEETDDPRTSAQLLGNTEQSTSPKKGVKIPVLGRVQAGVPVDAIEEILDYEEITQEMASQGEHFGLRVNGDSMEPKFSNGDVVIVRKQPDADTGDIAIVLVNGSDATIKKIKKRPDGIMLVPTNPMYEVMFYNNQEMEQLPVRIIGKVVELRAKF